MKKYLIVIFIILFVGTCCQAFCSEYKKYVPVYKANQDLYEMFLRNDEELSKYGEIQLWGLRLLIDIRLENEEGYREDREMLWALAWGNSYLEKEVLIKYLPDIEHHPMFLD